jgi:acetyl-CoA carboxylase biotin carboxyl carrier protein
MTEARNRMATPKDVFDPDLIRELARLLEETGLGEIEIEKDGARVRVAAQTRAASPAAGSAVAPPAPASIQPSSGEAVPVPTSHAGLVISPMVGTAYLAAEPGARPFVEIGSQV